jgi:bifunctional non-homologous end joining protein LigD
MKRGDKRGDKASAGDVGTTLRTYRSKRNPAKTPEPMGDESQSRGQADASPMFVVQEHHARALHWDFRLEHEGVLVSWALPKGVPDDPQSNHLAIHTEDHPMSYGSFAGEIPAGEYGGGDVRIWDTGTFELEKWSPSEVMVVLHGSRVSGRYVLFATNGKNWMIHRMDPAPPNFQPPPKRVSPMLATAGKLPLDDTGWAYEIKWDGVRAITFVDGGRVRMQSRNDNELSHSFPEFREIGEFLGTRRCVIDGEIIVLGDHGVPDFGRLQQRLHLSAAGAIRRRSEEFPGTYVAFDLLYLDGRSLVDLSYDQRREQLESLNLSGNSFTTADSFRDAKGADVLKASRQAGLEGVVAKRRDAPYLQGKRGDAWIKVKNERTQEVVIGGWTEGSGNRTGSIGALLLGIPVQGGLRYVGKVGTGFSDEDRAQLIRLFSHSERKRSPFVPSSDIVESGPHHFVRPVHVGEVRFSEWTSAGRLRHPTWRGIRSDKGPEDVAVEG